MKTTLLLLLLTVSAFAAETPAPKEAARAAVLSGDLTSAIVIYADAARSQNAELVAEYGWALTKAGHTDLGLAQIDRALQLNKTNSDVLYYTSSVLSSLGLGDVAQEISRPAPAWLSGNEKLPATVHGNLAGNFRDDINTGTGLIMQRRYASSVDRYAQMTKKYPRERYAWAGYAIALESIGAYKAAAKAVAKDMELAKGADENTIAVLTAHKKELEERAPLETPTDKKANEMLKGRYLLFFGGSINKTDTDTITNINARAGKFLTDHFDVGVNAGFTGGYSLSDYNGLSAGISTRYLTPLPVSAPLSFVLGARAQYAPSPVSDDRTTLYLSPGLSYFLPNGSLDLTLDLGLSGPLKDSRTLSVGYTMYMGGSK